LTLKRTWQGFSCGGVERNHGLGTLFCLLFNSCSSSTLHAVPIRCVGATRSPAEPASISISSTEEQTLKSDLTMSESFENDEPRASLLEYPLNDRSIGSLQNSFRALEHEVVRYDETCSMCSNDKIDELLRTSAEADEVFGRSFAEVLHCSTFCWFCRFVCRSLACSLSLEHFTQCVNEDLPVKLYKCSGSLERSLLVTQNDLEGTDSYEMDFTSPDFDNQWVLHHDLRKVRYCNVVTCQDLKSPP
jgi:hypothetical protein